MKRFIAFGGAAYYASGGLHDIVGSFDDSAEAIRFAERTEQVHPDIPRQEDVFEWWHILDSHTMTCIAASPLQAYGAAHEIPDLTKYA